MIFGDVNAFPQTHSLKSTVYQVSFNRKSSPNDSFWARLSKVQGQVSGRTILPMPVGVEKCITTARELQENAECSVDLYLKSAIEGVVIKWVTQINGKSELLTTMMTLASFFRCFHGNIGERLQQRSKSGSKLWWVEPSSTIDIDLHI